MARRPLRAVIPHRGGATAVEYLVVLGLVAFGSMGVARTMGATTAGAANVEAEHVRDFTGRGAGGASGGAACTSGDCGRKGSHCFAAGTLVATPSGPQPIERVVAGDRVLSEDETTGEVSPRDVTATFVTDDADVLDLFVEGQADPVRTTPGHRFFTLDRGWRESQDLEPGEPLVDDDGVPVRVLRLEHETERTRVYNFEVDVTHTYFVGPRRILVHNPMVDLRTGLENPGDDPLPLSYYKPPADGGTTCILKTHDDKVTIDHFAATIPHSEVHDYETLGPGSLAHCKHLIISAHGSPGNIKKRQNGTIYTEPAAFIVGHLTQAGFVSRPGSELFVGSCNSGTCRWNPHTKKAMPSILEALAHKFQHTALYGPQSYTPAAANAGQPGDGPNWYNEVGGKLVADESGTLLIDPRPVVPGWPLPPHPPRMAVSDGDIVRVAHDPSTGTLKTCFPLEPDSPPPSRPSSPAP